MTQAAQLLEFDPKGKFVREIGKNNFALAYAHAVRIDKQDNIWIVDKGSNVILKMNPQGRVVWVFGRRGESSHLDVPPDYASQMTGILERAGVAITRPQNNNPRNPLPVHRDNVFNQPTDVAWDSQGNSYFTDGYINSRVAKANARGRVGRQLGIARQRPRPVRHAARHRGVAEGRDLRRRSRQPPHPGARHQRQVPARVHHRRAGRYQARQDRLRRARTRTARPDRWRPARPMRCA